MTFNALPRGIDRCPAIVKRKDYRPACLNGNS
jgi:hypothetical protein